jgi:cytochrome c peroxidase
MRCAWLAAIIVASAPIGRASAQSTSAAGRQALRVELGRKLFFDPRLSADGSTACASCHDPAHGWADGRRVAVGLIRGGVGRPGTRNTPSIINAAFSDGPQFWDMRARSLLEQATQPITNPIEMGNQTLGQVVGRLDRVAGYRPLFAAAFGTPGASPARLAAAIAAFERTVVSFDAPVDRFLAGDDTALTPAARRGLALARAGACFDCHKPPLYADGLVHNVGISLRSGNSVAARPDNGRAAIVGAGPNNVNVRAFKTPTLREIARTAPYMHDGSLATLADVVEHFDSGGRFVRGGQAQVDSLLDSRIRPLGLTAAQKQDLLTFLVEGFASPDYPYIERPVLP